MSFAYFHGIISVGDGHKVQTTRANGTVVWHAVYNAGFALEISDCELDGSFRAFAPASASTIPPNTLVLVHGKFAFPPKNDKTAPSEFILESINHSPFVMDVENDQSDAFLPTDTVPTLNVLGSVVGSAIQMEDGAKAIDVKVSSYIQNKTVECIFRCVSLICRIASSFISYF